MQVTIEIPGSLADQLRAAGKDPARAALLPLSDVFSILDTK